MIPRDILNLAPTKNDDKDDIVPSLDLKGNPCCITYRGGSDPVSGTILTVSYRKENTDRYQLTKIPYNTAIDI